MDHPLNNDDFTIDPRKADAFDKALDALGHGDRRKMRKVEPDMRDTVDRMFALADVAGIAPAGTKPAPERSRIRQFVRPAMTWVSAAAVILLLAVMVNRTFPESPLNSRSFGTTVVTPDGSRTVTPEEARPDYPVVNTVPLDVSECVVDPRPRDQVAAILGVPPKNGNEDLPELYDTTFSDIEWDDIQKSYREWQACLKNGRTYQAMALETVQFIGDDAYGSAAIVGLPFSDATIDALLDVREAQDAQWVQQGSSFTADSTLLMILPDGTVAASEDGTVVLVQVAWYNTRTTQRESAPGTAVFQLVNDTWQIAAHQVPMIPTMAESGGPETQILPTLPPGWDLPPTIVPTVPPETGSGSGEPVMTPPPATVTPVSMGGDNAPIPTVSAGG